MKRIQELLDEQNLIPVWVGRRAFIEVVEEISDFIFSSLVITFFYYLFVLWFGLNDYNFVAYLLCIMLAGIPLFVELKQWTNEIHVVAQYEDGGGMLFKLKGWLSKENVFIPITKASPIPTVHQPMHYRLWTKITGEAIERVSLTTDAHKFLTNNRMPTAYSKAIGAVRGAKPAPQDIPDAWKLLDAIRRNQALVGDTLATEAAQRLLIDSVFGHD